MPTWTTRLKGLATLLASLILTVYILDQKGVLVYDGAALLPQLRAAAAQDPTLAEGVAQVEALLRPH